MPGELQRTEAAVVHEEQDVPERLTGLGPNPSLHRREAVQDLARKGGRVGRHAQLDRRTAAVAAAEHRGVPGLVPKLLDAIERHAQEHREDASLLRGQRPGGVYPHRPRLPHLRSERLAWSTSWARPERRFSTKAPLTGPTRSA